jgi:segregation and condensation protein B
MDSLPLKQIIEGAILAAEAPLSIDHLMRLFEGDEPERVDVRDALKEIEQECEGRGFELKQVASGYRFQVRSSYGEWVSRLWKEKPPRYSRALLETLALIAYKQPITRGDVEEIRGVAVSTNIIRTLLEREWVRIVGHRDVPGHPALYATTKNFLDYFNLRNLDELPGLAEIKDLTMANEELDMEDDLIELPSLEVDVEEEEAVAGMDDADLDAVSDQVDTIQQNIKNLLAADELALAGEFDEDDSEALGIEQQSEPEVVEQRESISSESDTNPGTEIQSTSDDNSS